MIWILSRAPRAPCHAPFCRHWWQSYMIIIMRLQHSSWLVWVLCGLIPYVARWFYFPSNLVCWSMRAILLVFFVFWARLTFRWSNGRTSPLDCDGALHSFYLIFLSAPLTCSWRMGHRKADRRPSSRGALERGEVHGCWHFKLHNKIVANIARRAMPQHTAHRRDATRRDARHKASSIYSNLRAILADNSLWFSGIPALWSMFDARW